MFFLKKNDNFDKVINQIQIKKGLVLKLYGDLGSGKTTFARYFIQNLYNDFDLEIVSPSFSILEIYDNKKIPIWHFDLYRLKNKNDFWNFDTDKNIENQITLIEWPQIINDVFFDNEKSLFFVEDKGKYYIKIKN